jgi:hypothetical protein
VVSCICISVHGGIMHMYQCPRWYHAYVSVSTVVSCICISVHHVYVSVDMYQCPHKPTKLHLACKTHLFRKGMWVMQVMRNSRYSNFIHRTRQYHQTIWFRKTWRCIAHRQKQWVKSIQTRIFGYTAVMASTVLGKKVCYMIEQDCMYGRCSVQARATNQQDS